jgi:very-short-patch-repair endonuclease
MNNHDNYLIVRRRVIFEAKELIASNGVTAERIALLTNSGWRVIRSEGEEIVCAEPCGPHGRPK